jgi:hypothetical protein
MLVIRKEQMDAMNRVVLDGYIRQLAAIFLERHPEKFESSGVVGAESFVRENLPFAQKYGANSERAIAMFLYFVLLHGNSFATNPNHWAAKMLTDPEEPDGDARVERLIGWMEAYAAESPAPRTAS